MTDIRVSRHKQAFFLALGMAVIIFLPFVLFDGGYFVYYGDFNVQQIPFYKLAHEAVRSGNIFWNWNTDLGVNFIGSYTFYLLFSPFFWLTLPFPTAWVPFLMAPLLVLKFGCAAFTSYFYLARFVRNSRWAVVGSLLYAFSGWMMFNVFFNHFLEVAVFFPLLLLGIEKLVVDGDRRFFAVAVAVNALVNYWFFIGEVVFVVLYFFFRLTDRRFRSCMSARVFFRLCLEAVVGTGCACVALVPSVLALSGNPRTGVDELLTGWNFWLYWHEQRLPAILQSLFFPPELPARPNFFPDHGAKWASLSGWMPLVGLTGVLAYFFQRRGDWLKKILAACLVMALIPGLNSLFILLNNSYYARWFYMPVLLMALATARALEDSAYDMTSFSRALKWCAGISAVFIVMSGLTPNFDEEEQLRFGMADSPPLLWAYAAVVAAGLLVMALLLFKLRHNRRFLALTGTGVALISIVFMIFYMANGKNTYTRSQYVINTAIKGRENIYLPQEPFARSDAYDAMDNLLMFWGLPNIQAFHSIVPPSIMEFYPAVGVKRDVGSRPEPEYYALRPLLSVRWLFIEADREKQEPMPGYKKYTEQAGFNIYENENWLPMGFAYDKSIIPEDLEQLSVSHRDNVLLKAVVLDQEAAIRNADLLRPFDIEEPFTVGEEDLKKDCDDRRVYTAEGFYHDRWGFGAQTDFASEQFVFFSVPWEEGWSAFVNGERAVIEKANIGFMALRVPEGPCELRFEYRTPGLVAGLFVTIACVLYLVADFGVYRYRRAKKGRAVKEGGPAPDGTVYLTAEQFQEEYRADDRRAHLQRTLNEASRRSVPERLPEEEQAFRFVVPEQDGGEKAGEGPD